MLIHLRIVSDFSGAEVAELRVGKALWWAKPKYGPSGPLRKDWQIPIRQSPTASKQQRWGGDDSLSALEPVHQFPRPLACSQVQGWVRHNGNIARKKAARALGGALSPARLAPFPCPPVFSPLR